MAQLGFENWGEAKPKKTYKPISDKRKKNKNKNQSVSNKLKRAPIPNMAPFQLMKYGLFVKIMTGTRSDIKLYDIFTWENDWEHIFRYYSVLAKLFFLFNFQNLHNIISNH